MQIVLPGALPDAAIARELAPHLEKNAPRLAAWLARAHAEIIAAKPADTLCTPYEYWLLRHHGFAAGHGEVPSSGLAAVYALDTQAVSEPEAPLWLAQLVHVAPARDGAALIPASELEITAEESSALFAAAAEYFDGSGFEAQPFDTTHWRMLPPADYRPHCASPALVSITSVNDWWSQDTAGRPWRRLVNELQMLWFNHPVNQARESRGLRPINSLWLYGGAAPGRLAPPQHGGDLRVLRQLQGPALVQDWGSWLSALQQLEAEDFAALDSTSRVVMTGSDCIVELAPAKQGMFSRMFGTKKDWRRWWSDRS